MVNIQYRKSTSDPNFLSSNLTTKEISGSKLLIGGIEQL